MYRMIVFHDSLLLQTGVPVHSTSVMRSARSDPDFRHVHAVPREQTHSQLTVARDHPRLRSASEANLLQSAVRTNRRHSIAPIDPGYITHGARKRVEELLR